LEESEFNQLIDTVLAAIEEAVESSDEDIDYDTVQGILTLGFADASRIIINRQAVNNQLWVAAKSGGFHFNLVNGQWLDERDGVDLAQRLNELIFKQCEKNIPITL